MPTWVMASGDAVGIAFGAGTTRYTAPAGALYNFAIEAQCQVLARDSYTLANLYVRVTINTVGAASTVDSRVGGGDGTQQVSIGAGLTGDFSDAVNTDALVTGDLFNSKVIVGAGGNLTLTIVSFTLATVANNTPIIVTATPHDEGDDSDGFFVIVGNNDTHWGENRAKYTIRTATTLSNFRIYIYLNTINAASEARPRVNNGNVNQVVNIGALTTGDFEDAGNTDVIGVGDNVCLAVFSGIDAGQEIGWTLAQLKSTSVVRQTGVGEPKTDWLAFGLTRYLAIAGQPGSYVVAEVDAQCLTRQYLTARNMFVSVDMNTLDGASTIHIRKSGVNGTLTVSIPLGATGEFEDLVNSDNFTNVDTMNWRVVTGGTAGDLDVGTIGFEQVQLVGPSGTPAGALTGASGVVTGAGVARLLL